MATRLYESEDDQDDDPSRPALTSEHDEPEEDFDASSTLEMIPPLHPMPCFQDAFEESIQDATTFDHDAIDPPNDDVQTRRRKLLQAETYQDIRAKRFDQRPDAVYHPILKLCAQIVFGMHLLQHQQAKSNKEVVRILQNHVNDVDSLLERTSEDLDLAFKDVKERVRCLKLPLDNMEVFQSMLADAKFRADLFAGNEKIEKIVRRTGQALSDSMMDVQTGLKSTRELGSYLNRVEGMWPRSNIEIGEVYAAMRGNEQGWKEFLIELQKKGYSLGEELKNLAKVISEMSKLAAAASRREKSKGKMPPALQISTSSPSPRNHSGRTHRERQPGLMLDKPLPTAPGRSNKDILIKAHPVPFSMRYEQPRPKAPVPGTYTSYDPSSNRHAQSPTGGKGHTSRDGRSRRRKEATGGYQDSPSINASMPRHGESSTKTTARHVARTRSEDATAVLRTRPEASNEHSTLRSFGDMTDDQHRRTKSMPQNAVDLIPNPSSTPMPSDTVMKFVPQEGNPHFPEIRAGFSERPSSKKKQPPAQLKYLGPEESVAVPIDSAYSSGSDQNQRRRNKSSPDLGQERKATPQISTPEQKPVTNRGSRLSLFPQTPNQPVATGGTYYPAYDTSNPYARTWTSLLPNNPAPSKQSGHQPKSSRTINFRKFFQMKGDSGSALVS